MSSPGIAGVNIRAATMSDLEAITQIYNEAIANTTATFDTEPKSLSEQKAWFRSHGGKHPILVAETDTAIAGWASLTRWSDRCAYSGTAEISLYVADNHRGRGIGTALASALIERARAHELHKIVARIAEGNGAGIHILESLAFGHIGVMRQVGLKFGRRMDVFLLQKMLDKQG